MQTKQTQDNYTIGGESNWDQQSNGWIPA